MKRVIQFFAHHYCTLRDYFGIEKVRESGALLLCKLSTNSRIIRFISYKILLPEDKDYLERTPVYIGYHPDFLDRAFDRCVAEGCHLIAIHNHPFEGADVSFSPHDNHSDQYLLGPYAGKYFSNLQVGSIVFNGEMSSADARMYSQWTKTLIPVEQVTIIGRDGMRILPTTGSLARRGAYSFNPMHHRTVLAMGAQAQERFSRLTVGVVGVGGNGNPVSELLSRMGVHSIAMADFDRVERTNLGRLTGTTTRDAQYKRLKVKVMERELRRGNPQIKVLPLQSDFLNPRVQQSLKHCDIIFGCADNDLVRFALNKFTLANGIVYFDLGCGATVKNGRLANAGGQCIKVVPGGHYCLQCGSYFNSENLKVALMTESERQASASLNYISGDVAAYDRTSQPAVGALNKMTASLAVWWMQRYVSGNAERADGIGIDAMNYSVKPWIHPSGENKDCLVCGQNGLVGQGDDADPYLMTKRMHSASTPRLPECSEIDSINEPETSMESVEQAHDDAEESLGQRVDFLV